MGKMAEMFFNKVGEKFFYICMIIYLYGDLAIYAAAVPKSLRNVACTYAGPNGTNCSSNQTLGDNDLCWASSSLTRMDAYRIFVAAFLLFLGPFSFFNVQKTKYLQICTSVARWLAFGMMIVLAIVALSKGEGKGHPPVGNISGIPNLFGVCVYSFMCHHSLPSLVTPIKNKSNLFGLLLGDFTLILCFYALLSFTGIYTFSTIDDLYTLNFFDPGCGDSTVTSIKPIGYFLALFPVFTLSTSFPIISITLRNNIDTMCSVLLPDTWPFRRVLYPLLAILPPIAVAFGTNQVEFLVGITGSYAGAGIQYVIPAFLVYLARKDVSLTYGYNHHRSRFRHGIWIILVFVWSGVCIIFVTVNHIITRK